MLQPTREEKFANEVKPDAVAAAKEHREVPIELRPGYKPSQASKYFYCKKFKAKPFVCNLPRKSCTACEHHELRPHRAPGRPIDSGLYDWRDVEDRRFYMREYMRDRRARERALEDAKEN